GILEAPSNEHKDEGYIQGSTRVGHTKLMLKSIKKYSLTSLPVWQILKKIPITWFIYILFFAYGLIGIF
ncbi:hypothetical protein Rin_00022550, partial [Candidatus Regiella insecticola 5.15]